MNDLFKKLCIISVVIALTALAMFTSNTMYKPMININNKRIIIDPNQSFIKTLAKLNEINPSINVRLSKIIFRITGSDKKIKPGIYILKDGENLNTIINRFMERDTPYFKIQLPDGADRYQIQRELSNQYGLFGEFSLPDEGHLKPDTYIYQYGDKAQTIVDQMHKEQESIINELLHNETKINKKNIITLASIIEKETSCEAEKAKIAGVFLNRIKRNMKLQSDATVIYAIKSKHVIPDNYRLMVSELSFESPMNTYIIKGLPPQAISNPSRGSIIAAMNPESHDLLYFVANENGCHTFATNFHTHRKNILKYQIFRKNSYQKLPSAK